MKKESSQNVYTFYHWVTFVCKMYNQNNKFYAFHETFANKAPITMKKSLVHSWKTIKMYGIFFHLILNYQIVRKKKMIVKTKTPLCYFDGGMREWGLK